MTEHNEPIEIPVDDDEWLWVYILKDKQGLRNFKIGKQEMLKIFSRHFDKDLPSKESNFSRIVNRIIENDRTSKKEAEERAHRLHQEAVDRHASLAFERFAQEFVGILTDFFKDAQIEAITYALKVLRKIPIEIMNEPAILVFNHAHPKVLQKQVTDMQIAASKKRQGATSRGQHSQWAKAELESVLQGAFAILPKPSHTYSEIATLLKNIYGDKAPESGEALRKLVTRIGIDWKQLKTDSNNSNTVR